MFHQLELQSIGFPKVFHVLRIVKISQVQMLFFTILHFLQSWIELLLIPVYITYTQHWIFCLYCIFFIIFGLNSFAIIQHLDFLDGIVFFSNLIFLNLGIFLSFNFMILAMKVEFLSFLFFLALFDFNKFF